MTRTVPLAIAAILVVGSIAVGASVAGSAPTDVSIRSANASIDQPAPGETFTVTTEVANPQGNGKAVAVTDVYIRKTDSATEYARAEDVGAISPGESIRVPLPVRIDERGEKRLTVHAIGRTENGSPSHARFPLYVDVSEPDDVVLSVADPDEVDPVAGEETEMNVTVSNGGSGAISNARLEVGGDARVENAERVAATVESGAQVTYTYRVTYPDSGTGTLDATLAYDVAGGTTRTANRTITTEVEPATVDADLTTSIGVENGSTVIEATLAEYGNAELRDVRLRAVADGGTVERALLEDVPAEESRTAVLPGDDVPPGEVSIEADYTAAGERRTTSETMRYAPQSASNVVLSGLEFDREESTLVVSGDAANVGSGDARSVRVEVVGAEGVRPVPPNREYFIGAIDASEFGTFELTANASAGVETLPIRVQYAVDGEEFSRIVEVDVGDPEAAEAADSEGSGSGGPPGIGLPALAAVALVAAIGIGAVIWRRRGGSSDESR